MNSREQQVRDDRSHPRVSEPVVFITLLVMAGGGAIIGLQIITTLGVTPNTSLIGVLFAIMLSRVPITAFQRFRSVHQQNLVQTTISSGTFGAANCMLLTIGIPVALDEPDLVMPMFAGAAMAMLIDLLMLYWLYDSRIFPAKAAWPPGIAAAEAIIAGDQGGKRAGVLLIGSGVGALGAFAGIPMSGAGVAFIGNIWALSMFAVGLFLAGYSDVFFSVTLSDTYIPHGVMIGAGLVALVQAILLVVRRSGSTADNALAPAVAGGAAEPTRSDQAALIGLGRGAVLYVLAGTVLALAGGLFTEMSPLMVIGFALFAAVACIAAEFIVGLSAMHAGWFPAFATALVFLFIGMAVGFPAPAVVLMAGFVAAGSPAFADAGYDFKAGWVLRDRGRDPAFELEGRRQQLLAGLIGFVVAAVIVFFVHDIYFSNDLFAPSSRVFAAAIDAGLGPDTITEILLWAVPGALIQVIGGSSRQMGVLLATGLIVADPMAAYAVAGGLIVRIVVLRVKGAESANMLAVFGGGIIAGDAVYSFADSLVKAR
ncbi:OPT/YSL family transporter [Haloactinopolyspora sp.]|uniref:OPT/YSL family transporter n=1 Tax=Haloactinopolyspora sp. TaxID=1966353 RepID=UPI002637FBDF|nr:OPT/YSL family transporter [Haloactinopolyspora sp.]